MMTLPLPSAQATEDLGGRLARAVRGGTCTLYLRGELGTGKTTLVRGFLRGLGYAGSVKSPTYTLVEPYTIGSVRVFHFDFYRLADPEELEYIGIRDFLDGPSILLVEWPERGEGMLPLADLDIELYYMGEARLCYLSAGSTLGEAMLALASEELSIGDTGGGRTTRT